MLVNFYAVAGRAPEVDGALARMAVALATRSTPALVNQALDACLELTFPVRIGDIISRLPGSSKADVDAEARAAWDVLAAHVHKWARWNDDYTAAFWDKRAPAVLSQRILDVIRRTGGLAVYVGMTFADRPGRPELNESSGKATFPFVQSRFFEEFKAWTKVEAIDRAKLIAAVPKIEQLTEQKSLTAATTARTEVQKQPVGSPEFRKTVAGIMKHIQGPNKFRRRV